jgi:hypothetical protein
MQSPFAASHADRLRRGLDPQSRAAPTAQPWDARGGLTCADRQQAPLSARRGRSAGSPGRGPALRASPGYTGADVRGERVERRRRRQARSWPTARIGSAGGLTRRAGSRPRLNHGTPEAGWRARVGSEPLLQPAAGAQRVAQGAARLCGRALGTRVLMCEGCALSGDGEVEPGRDQTRVSAPPGA